MPTPILMPKLGDIMTEGTVAKWLVPPGQPVAKGQPLMEVATDKITYEVPAVESGVLHAVLAEGQVAPVGGLVGYLLAPGEAAPAATGVSPSPQPSPSRGEGGGGAHPPPLGGGGGGGGERSAAQTGVPPPSSSLPPGGGRTSPLVGAPAPGEPVRATPAARRLAKDLGVDIERLSGTGPAGRVTEDDVRNAFAAPSPQPSPTGRGGAPAVVPARPEPVEGRAPVQGAPSREPPYQAVPLSSMRRRIAQRMHGSLQQTAQLTFTLEADVTDLVAARRQYLREHRGPGAVRVSYLHLIIKAAAEALVRHPLLNSALVGDELHQYQQVNVGFAVALDEGLLVPVVRDAGKKSVEEIGRQADDLLARARANRLTLDDMSGGTFTVSVLGSVDAFTPILNPPEVALLGVGRFAEKPVVHKGAIAARTLVTLSLTTDHRAIDGAPAAAFLRRLRLLLESPATLFGAAPPPDDAAEEE